MKFPIGCDNIERKLAALAAHASTHTDTHISTDWACCAARSSKNHYQQPTTTTIRCQRCASITIFSINYAYGSGLGSKERKSRRPRTYDMHNETCEMHLMRKVATTQPDTERKGGNLCTIQVLHIGVGAGLGSQRWYSTTSTTTSTTLFPELCLHISAALCTHIYYTLCSKCAHFNVHLCVWVCTIRHIVFNTNLVYTISYIVLCNVARQTSAGRSDR